MLRIHPTLTTTFPLHLPASYAGEVGDLGGAVIRTVWIIKIVSRKNCMEPLRACEKLDHSSS